MPNVIKGDDIIQGTLARPEPFLGPYLAPGETMMLYAPTGQGKTVNALMLGIALSTGTKFYEWQVEKPMPVLFVEGGELTATGISERMRKIYAKQGIVTDPNFHLFAPTKDNSFRFDITRKEHQNTLTDYIDSHGIKVVIFDNYNSLREEADNEFMCWKRLEDFLSRLKTRGVSSVVVHHTNKEGRQQSGVQRKADYCDLIIRIQKSILCTKQHTYIEFEMEKFRWGEELPIQLIELVFGQEHLDLVPVDYDKTLEASIENDLVEYSLDYVRQKYRFLGYKLHHYVSKEVLGGDVGKRERERLPTPRDFL